MSLITSRASQGNERYVPCFVMVNMTKYTCHYKSYSQTVYFVSMFLLLTDLVRYQPKSVTYYGESHRVCDEATICGRHLRNTEVTLRRHIHLLWSNKFYKLV